MAYAHRPHAGKNSPFWWDVPPVASTFVGREAELVELHELLTAANPGVPVAITGLCGVGKTALASAYVHHTSKSSSVIWINANSKDSITLGFWRLAITSRGMIPGPDVTLKLAEYEASFKSLPKSLLVFDGLRSLEHLKMIMEHINPSAQQIKILATTRQKNIISRSIHLSPLRMEQAIDLIRMEVQGASEQDARVLAEATGCLPIALHDAALFMKSSEQSSSGGFTASNFIEKHLDENRANTFLSSEYGPMATLRAFMDAIPPRTQIQHVGCFAAGLPSSVPLQLLILLSALRPAGTTAEFLDRARTEFVTKNVLSGDTWNDCLYPLPALDELEACSLVEVRRSADGANKVVSTHPILRKTVVVACGYWVRTAKTNICIHLVRIISIGEPGQVEPEYLLQAVHLLKFYIAETLAGRRNLRFEFLIRLHDGLVNFGLMAEAEFVATEAYAYAMVKNRPGAQRSDPIPQLGLLVAKWRFRKYAYSEAMRVLEEVRPSSKGGYEKLILIWYIGSAQCGLGQLTDAEQTFTEALRLFDLFDLRGLVTAFQPPLIPVEFLQME